MRVVILGCGPTGLLAAYACEREGHTVEEIYSKKIKSVIPGAVFLHERIPGGITAPNPDGVIDFFKYGDKEGYAEKVYGNQDADCSWDLFPEGQRPAWSMFNLYNQLWEIYRSRVISCNITSNQVIALVKKSDRVISTVPAKAICFNPDHEFYSQGIYILDKSAYKMSNTIVYNGSSDDVWYRTSNLFGHGATESTKPFGNSFAHDLGAKVSRGFKPLRTDCDCHPEVARIGRFGRWEKGILVHHAYKHTIQLLGET